MARIGVPYFPGKNADWRLKRAPLWVDRYQQSGSTLAPVLLTDGCAPPAWWPWETIRVGRPPDQFGQDDLAVNDWIKAHAFELLGECIVSDLDVHFRRPVEELLSPQGGRLWMGQYPENFERYKATSDQLCSGVMVIRDSVLEDFKKAWHDPATRSECKYMPAVLGELAFTRISDGPLPRNYHVVSNIRNEYDDDVVAVHYLGKRGKQMLEALLDEKPVVSVCIATHDEYENTWNTITSILLHDNDLVDEIVICDNSPAGSKHAELLKRQCRGIQKVVWDRIVAPPSALLYKDRAIRKSSGDVIIVCDCHVQFHEGAIKSVVDYFRANRNSKNLIMGPCYNSAVHLYATNQMLYSNEPYEIPESANVRQGVVMRGGTYGVWVTDNRALNPESAPFEIQQQGTGAMAFHRNAWTTPLRSFYGHGGTETWIMERFRQNGGKVLCHPKFRWVHQWGRPGMATETRNDLARLIAKVPSKQLQKQMLSVINDAERATYKMSGGQLGPTHQKCFNSLAAANDLGRVDLYDAAVEEFNHGGKDGKPLWPDSCKTAQKLAPRPGLYEELMPIWEQHGGQRSGAIPAQLFRDLEATIRQRPNAKILEFGSGLSTLLFDTLGVDATSVENSKTWFQRLRVLLKKESTKLILSPLEETASGPWYDWRAKPGEKFDIILVDGPLGEGNAPGRSAAKHFLADIMADECIIFLDDTHREKEIELSDIVTEIYGFDRQRIVCA